MNMIQSFDDFVNEAKAKKLPNLEATSHSKTGHFSVNQPLNLMTINVHIQEKYPDLEVAYDEDDKHAYWHSTNKEVGLYLAGLPETTVNQEAKTLEEWMTAADEIMNGLIQKQLKRGLTMYKNK